MLPRGFMMKSWSCRQNEKGGDPVRLPYKYGAPVRLVSGYGQRYDPITGERTHHGGYDLVSDGDKTICAVCAGEVVFSRMITDKSNRTWEWGNYVCIRGDDGRLYYYCHLSAREVSAGERVHIGDIIGIEGTTGRSTGSHLHFEVRDGSGKQMNPETIIGVPNNEGTYVMKGEGDIMPGIRENNPEKNEAGVTFGDSEPAEWARDAVEWAIDNGIIYGDENGDLMLRKPCTREQMLVFLYRLAEYLGKV